MGKRAVIYARVSTLTKGQDPEAQVPELQELAMRMGYELIREPFLEYVSTRKPKLPLRAEVLDLARRRKVDAIFTWRLDRWGRSLQDLVATTRELDELGVLLIVPGMPLPDTAMGRMFRDITAVFAEFERELARERINMGLAHARSKGKRLGRPKLQGVRERVWELLILGRSWDEVVTAVGCGRRTVARVSNEIKALPEDVRKARTVEVLRAVLERSREGREVARVG